MLLLINILYAFIVLGSCAALLSMEYYSRKAGVAPAPSTPWMRKATIRCLSEVIKERGQDNPVIYELGAGWGALAIAAAKANPKVHIVGFEISPVPLWIARIRAKLGGLKNVEFRGESFFDSDFSKADIVLTYLTINLLGQVKPHLENGLPQGAHIICNTFAVPGWEVIRIEHVTKVLYDFNVYIYEIGKQ